MRPVVKPRVRSEEHTSELQSRENLVCRLLLEKKKKRTPRPDCDRTWHARQPPRCDPEGSQQPLAGLLSTPGHDGVPAAAGGGVFFFNDTATTEIYTLSLHGALPI